MDPRIVVFSPHMIIDDYKLPSLREIVRITQLLKGPLHTLIAKQDLSKKIDEALEIADIAVRCFTGLSDEAKLILFEMKIVLEEKARDPQFVSQLMENPPAKDLHNRMVDIFIGKLYGKELPGTVFFESRAAKSLAQSQLMQKNALSAATSKEESLFSQIEEEFDLIKSTLSQDPITCKAIERRKKIVGIISGFFIRFIRVYYPHFFPKGKHLGVDLSAYLIQTFETHFPDVVPYLFFSLPTSFGKKEMNNFTCIFKKAVLFLHDYNDALESVRTRESRFDGKPPEDQELVILHWIKENRLRERIGNKTLSSPSDIMALLGQTIEETILLSLPPKIKDSTHPSILRLSVAMAAGHLLPVFDRLLAPDVFTFAIKRFLTGDSLKLDPETEDVDLRAFGKGSKEFDKEIGIEIEKLSKEIFRLGSASTGLSAIQKIAMGFKETIAAAIQLKIRAVYASESTLLPILVLNHLLFQDEKPICLHYFTQEEKEQKREQEKMREELGFLIRAKIKELTAGPAFSIAMAFTSIESFTDELGKALVDLIHRPALIRLLLVYLLTGLNEGLNLAQKEKS